MKSWRIGMMFRAVFFFLMSYFCATMVISGKFLQFLHVRFRPMLIFAAVLFALMGLVTTLDVRLFRAKRLESLTFMLLLLPLLLYTMPQRDIAVPLPAPSKNVVTSSGDDMLRKAIEQASAMDAKQEAHPLNLEDLTGADQFVEKLEKLYQSPHMEGKSIDLVGVVFRFPNAASPRPVFVGRLLMFCCAADAMPVGFFIEGNPDLPKEGSWVKIRGKVRFVQGKQSYVALEVEDVTPIAAQESMYVYPPSVL